MHVVVRVGIGPEANVGANLEKKKRQDLLTFDPSRPVPGKTSDESRDSATVNCSRKTFSMGVTTAATLMTTSCDVLLPRALH